MKKPIKTYITSGVDNLLKENNLSTELLNSMFIIADRFYKFSHIITFGPHDGIVSITDGNNNLLGEFNSSKASDRLWIITDDYGDHLIRTAIFPNEY